MEKQDVFSGKTVEEAIEAGLNALSLTKDEVEIEVLEEGKKKLFGSVPAQVKITQKKKLSDGERAVAFLEGLFGYLQKEVTVVLTDEKEKIVIELHSGETKGLIGRRGETIDAIQALAGAVANKGRRDYKRVVVDCGNYREEREETLKKVAEKLAAKAVRQGRKVKLEPMNPYERRIIHAALVDNPDVTTRSEGKDPNRVVVIIPKNLRPFDKNREGRGGRGKFDRDRGYDREKKYPKRELPAEGTPESSGTSFNKGSGLKRGGFSGFFGTYLGNSRDDEVKTDDAETTEE